MTKEEIFDKHIGVYHRSMSPNHFDGFCRSMDEYGEQQAIAFAEWIHQNDWIYYPRHHTGYWADLHTGGRVVCNEELYKLFLQTQSK